MGRKSRRHSPYVRTRRDSNQGASTASKVANWAGLSERPTVEQLERRQMLFALTVTADDVDPNTGIGTVVAFADYFIPSIFDNFIPQPQPPEVVIEGFGDEQPGPVGSGVFFLGSGIRTTHSIAPAGDYTVQPPDTQNQERYLRLAPNQTNEFFGFEFFNDSANPTFRVLASQAAFTIATDGPGDNSGLIPDFFRLDVIANNVVVGSFSGPALAALIQPGGNPALGIGTFVIPRPAGSVGFDSIRITALQNIAGNPAFRLDDLSYTLPGGVFSEFLDARRFGFRATLSGPVGASAVFTDLYGRDMIGNRFLGKPQGSEVLIGDPDDDGRPLNYGIGRIRILNSDARTALSMWGGVFTATTTPQPGVDFFDGLGAFTISDMEGLFTDFEDSGFGYAVRADQGGQLNVTGLPDGPGSIIVGSPVVRDFNNFNPGGFAPGVTNPITSGFNRPDQGIFVENGDINSVLIHGVVHGSSQFAGAVDKINIGYLVGSITVKGDLGSLVVGSDAGQWSPDPDFVPPNNAQVDQNNKTFSQLVVERTIGEVAIGGRGLMDITVVGDLNSPTTRPARDSYNYYEKEFVFGVPLAVIELDIIRQNLDNTGFVSRNPLDLFRASDQAMLFGLDWLRNDTLMGAEWIGSATGGVRIRGELSGQDTTNSEDRSDVFAFASDGSTEVVIEATNSLTTISPYFRIMDQDGRTLAAPEFPFQGGRFAATTLRWTPNAPGTYYVVITDPNGADAGTGLSSYTMNIVGMAQTTLGSYRTAAGSGFTDITTGEGNSINVLAGNIGSLRVGVGRTGRDGQDTAPGDDINTIETDDDVMSFQGGTISTPGTLYNITAGSDIGAPGIRATGTRVTLRIGGDLGSIYTGRSPVVGEDFTEGDLNYLDIQVGGRIAAIDVKGGIGMEQDFEDDNNGDPRAPLGANIVIIRTGTAGGRGDIGFIRTGFHIAGDAMSIQTSPGSTVGAFLVSQDTYDDPDIRSGIYQGQSGVPVTTGLGSDIRFVDFPQLDLANGVDILLPIIGDNPLVIDDDAGARISISVEGAPPGVQVGFARVLNVPDGGVVVAQISVDLSGGRTLRITPVGGGGGPGGPSTGVVGIGRIVITNSDVASGIEITGSVEVDVLRVVDLGGNGLDRFFNTTTGGDLVAADINNLNTLDIFGDLGRTQFPTWAAPQYAPFLGVNPGTVGDVNGALGFAAEGVILDDDFNGGIFRPVTDDNFAAGNAYLDDIGGPFDGWLNGIVIRTGSLLEARVRGSVGDLILQDDESLLTLLNVNADRVTALNGFDGIVGSIYARDMGRLEIGDGLASAGPSPLASSGIYASDDILEIISRQTGGVRINGNIVASNSLDPDFIGVPADGIRTIIVTGGSVRDAFISAQTLDSFWQSFIYGDDNRSLGDIGDITLRGTEFYGSEVHGRDLANLTITGAFYDASIVAMTGEIGTISADGFRNSTLTGDQRELRQNFISGARDLQRLTALNDISDLSLDIIGSVETGLTAVNITRSNIAVGNRITGFGVTNDIRGSEIVAGSIPTLTVGNSIRSTSITVAGDLTTLTAGNRIADSSITVNGPSGAIGTISALNEISGSISASGPIAAVTVTGGDLTAAILTTTERGNVGTLSAARDVAITADISGSLATIAAGRHIGRRADAGVILVRGDLQSATAPNGQLYADLRVGGSIVGAVTLGGASALPNANLVGGGSVIAFGSIGSVVITGDFDGDILSYTGGIASVAITNGSLLPGNTIAAFDGNLTSVVITNGSLFGNVHADYNITLLRIVGASDGVFGDIGVNPDSSAFTSYDSRRNQLPAGVGQDSAYQGARVTAGRDIVAVVVTNGSVFESSFSAGRNITSITISGSVGNDQISSGFGSFFTAADTIENIAISGSAKDTMFIAGVTDLGTDLRPGGTGLAADRVKSGTIARISIGGTVRRDIFLAGVLAGADGVYNTGDDRSALGISTINVLAMSNVSNDVDVVADNVSGSVAAVDAFDITTDIRHVNNDIADNSGGSGVSFSGSRTFDYEGAELTINVSGPGQFFFDEGAGRLIVRNSTSATNITVSSSNGIIHDFNILTNDDASLGNINLQGTVDGDSDITVDGSVASLAATRFTGTGTIAIGGDVGTMTFSRFDGGFIQARNVTTFRVNGNFGADNPLTQGEALVQLLGVGAVAVTGNSRGIISVDRDATSITITGTSERAAYRVGGTLGSFTAGVLSRSVVAVGNSLGTVAVGGEMFDSSIAAGLDLGNDGAFGGSGAAADVLSTGFIGTVTVGGNFRESDIVAGFSRGSDGFFGNTDDSVAAGRGTIGTVTIAGTQVGSPRNSESYRIASSGSIGSVTLGGQVVNGPIGNFAVEEPLFAPLPVQITDIRTTSSAGFTTSRLLFNQAINAATLSPALSVSEVRGAGDIQIRLVEGIDYTVSYDAPSNVALVNFSRSVTERNLPVVPGRPGPGVYRFELDQDLFRAKLTNQFIDGDGDGFAESGEDFSDDGIVGDAGDKLVAGIANTGAPANFRVDFYGPTNLNFVLDRNAASDGLPDINRTITVRGNIGDHPDNSSNFFSFASDVDLYQITLQAGQILRLGALSGAAQLARLNVLDPGGNALGAFIDSGTAISLPITAADPRDLTFPVAYLIKTTGTYTLSVGNIATIGATGTIPNIPIPPGGIGEYTFEVGIFDDGNSGFTSPTDSGDGELVVDAPASGAFAGADGVFGNADDPAELIVGNYVFTYSRGADGRPNTRDDLVTGQSGTGITTTRDGTGRLVTLIESAIGPAGRAGVPGAVAADVDIFHLNSRQPIAAGTKMKVTVRLAELGSDLGSAAPPAATRVQRAFVDNRGSVQFGLFDTSGSTAIDDATLVFSPTDFSPNGGPPNTVIAENSGTKYGYDANGDFYIEFVAPDRVGTPGAAATFALYIQGAFNSDYEMEVVTGGTGEILQTRQNVFIEPFGGVVDWLEASGRDTNVGPFTARTLGFTGAAANGQPVQEYILSQLAASLNSIFQSPSSGAGLDVVFSTNPADFEGEEFSTVYLSSTADPVAPLFDPFTGFNFNFLSAAFLNTQPYGFSEHSDPFNTDVSDEAVVFVPSFALQGYNASQTDIDAFAQSLTGAVARRVGELMGLRISSTNAQGGTTFDALAADVVDNRPGPGRAYTLPNFNRDLSGTLDGIQRTDFFLGQQNARSLLDKVLTNI